MLVALVLLAIEWLVYERDTLARLRRGRGGPPRPVAAVRAERLMGIAFDAPPRLLLLPPLLAVVIALHLSSRRRLGKGRRRAALAVRALLLAALVGALAGLQLVLPVDRLAVVFVVDLSDSVGTPGREEALAYLRQSLAGKQDEDVAGIVAFGADALVERLPSDLAEIDRIASTPVRDATDIGAALRLAGALFPDDAQKRIVLLSDGNDTTGSGQSEAALAAARGIQVETVLTGLAGRDEVLVQRLEAPSTARLGESIERVGRRHSSVAQPATVRLFVNGELAGTKPVDLEAGTTQVTFNFTPTGLRLPALPDGRRGRPRHVQPERSGRGEHHRQGRAQGAGRQGRRGRGRGAGDRARDRAPGRRHGHPRGPAHRTSPGSPTTTRSCWSTSRACGSRTRRWRRSRST